MSPVKSVLPPHFLSKILLHGVNWGGAFQVPGSEAHKDGLCGLRMGGAQAWGSSEGAGLRRGARRGRHQEPELGSVGGCGKKAPIWSRESV